MFQLNFCCNATTRGHMKKKEPRGGSMKLESGWPVNVAAVRAKP